MGAVTWPEQAVPKLSVPLGPPCLRTPEVFQLGRMCRVDCPFVSALGQSMN